MTTTATDRAREFVRALETFWKFQTTHPDAPPDKELILTLIFPNGLKQRVIHVTVFDDNSLRVTPEGDGVMILQIEQCSFSVTRVDRPPIKKAELPTNVISISSKPNATHPVIT